MSKRLRVMLVTPPYHSGVVEAAGVWLPLPLVYLAGHARAAGAEVEIYDAMSLGVDHAAIRRHIEESKPDLVAVTVITATEPDAREICATVKDVNADTVTVLGGVHPTFCWRDLLDHDPTVDVVVVGEGEHTFAELVRAVAEGGDLSKVRGLALRKDGKAYTTGARAFATDVDALVPAWDLIDWPRYFYRPHPEGRLAIVSSARGCKQACAFCSQQKLWQRTWRSRRPEAFVDELEMLRDTHDVRIAMLSDETPTVDRARWERLLNLLIERDLGIELLMETRVDDVLRDRDLLPRYKQAGISHIYIGVEATSQKTLDLYNKETGVEQGKAAIDLINSHDIVSETSFVLGGVDETAASIAATVETAKYYAPDMAFFLALAPWPYADMYPSLAPHVATTDYRRYNLVEPVLKPRDMTLDEVRKALHFATGAFFHDKFKNLKKLSPFKRDYMVKVLKLLIENSYLGKEMHHMAAHASMPEEVRQMLDESGLLPAAKVAASR